MEDYVLNKTRHCEDIDVKKIASETVYLYLFQGLSVKAIEKRIFESDWPEFSGWMSKTILNYFGIDTSPESRNKGYYKGKNPLEIAANLLKSENRSRRIVGELLLQRYV